MSAPCAGAGMRSRRPIRWRATGSGLGAGGSPRGGDGEQRPDGRLDVLGEARPRGHDGGKVGVARRPSHDRFPGTAGGTAGYKSRRKWLFRFGIVITVLRIFSPLVVGSITTRITPANPSIFQANQGNSPSVVKQ